MTRNAALHPVPDTPPRVLGLIRVSDERGRGEDLMSPSIQRTAINDYATGRGYRVDGWLEGIDESGSRLRSGWWQRLDQAVAAVEAGEVDVIVVWKFSRVARHRLRWAVAIDRVEAAGGRIESATEQLDVTTSAGRFARGVLAELQAFEAERIGEAWKEAHAQRVASGKPASGKARYGYVYDRPQKLHVPDPVTGPVLADMYRRYTSGESVYSLARWLNAHGHRTQVGGPWSDRSLRRVMDSGFAAGTFTHEGVRYDGVHEALISREDWQAYLDARETRRARPPRSERSEYLLSGMVRCARCGGPMTASTAPAADQRKGPRYRCKLGREIEACVGGYVQAWIVEDHVLAWLTSKAAEVDETAAGVEVQASRSVALEQDRRRLSRELVRVDESLTRLAVQNAEHPLPDQVYRSARAELEERQRSLVEALAVVERDQRRQVSDAPAAARGLLEEWDELTVPQRREILRGLMDCVLVRTGRPQTKYLRVVEWHEVRA